MWSPLNQVTAGNTLEVSPTDSIVYTVQNKKAGENILFNGDFQQGNKFFESDYVYAGTDIHDTPSAAGRYTVWRRARDFSKEYAAVYDHTTGNSSNGRMLVAKCIPDKESTIWKKTMPVKPNTRYRFSSWFINPHTGLSAAKVQMAVNGEKIGAVITAPRQSLPVSKPSEWQEFSVIWESGDFSTAIFSIESLEGNAEGTGICIDDIRLIPYFELYDTIKVNVTASPSPVIVGDSLLCQGLSVLDAGTFPDGLPYHSYRWYDLSTDQLLGTERFLEVNKAGEYSVEVSNHQCLSQVSFEVQPSAELLLTADTVVDICPNEPDYIVNYALEDGSLSYYDVLYDDYAQSAGFVNALNQSVSGDGYISMRLADNIPAGSYDARLIFTSSSPCGEKKEIALKIIVRINPYSLIAKKWDNVLALYNSEFNGGLDYTDVQWFKNGYAIENANKTYFYLGEGESFDENDRFSVLLTLADGSELHTCDFSVEQQLSSPVGIRRLVFANELINLPLAETRKYSRAVFRDLSGRIYSTQDLGRGSSAVQSPSLRGWYLLELENSVGKEVYKICVK